MRRPRRLCGGCLDRHARIQANTISYRLPCESCGAEGDTHPTVLDRPLWEPTQAPRSIPPSSGRGRWRGSRWAS